MSVCTSAIVAAKKAVSTPTAATTCEALGRMHVEPRHPRHQVHAGGDHRGRVDQRGDRRRAGHRVGQPHVQRDLRRLAGGADEQQHADQAGGDRRRGAPPAKAALMRSMSSVPSAKYSRNMPSRKPASPMRLVMNAFLPAAGLLRVLEPEADQQVRGQADALPADEQHQQRAAEHQQQHEEQEQVQVGEEARVALVVVHVAGRVDVDQRADAGDDQRHHRATGGRSRRRSRTTGRRSSPR